MLEEMNILSGLGDNPSREAIADVVERIAQNITEGKNSPLETAELLTVLAKTLRGELSVRAAGPMAARRAAPAIADRRVLISSARAQYRRGANWGGRTERGFVNGTVLAHGQQAISEAEAALYNLAG